MTAAKTFRRNGAPLRAAMTLIPVLALASGCEFLDALSEETASVDVFSTHHATLDDSGEMPDPAQGPGFETDMGWTVYLAEAVVTTNGVSLVECGGTEHSVDMYWGAYPEDLVNGDLALSGLGGVTSPVGDYCLVKVHYAPFEPDGSDDVYDTHVDGAVGTTVYLSGTAVRGDVSIDFEWQTDRSVTAVVDTSTLDGGNPFAVRESSSQNGKITVTKTYDRFFDGVEFDDPDSIDPDALIADTLANETRVHVGTEVRP